MEILEELGQRGIQVKGLSLDSRTLQPGDVFVAMKGHQVDGRDYIAAALERGAAAVIAERDQKVGGGGTAPIVEVEGLDRIAGDLAHLVYGRPSERLWLAGVTGTNGKTSVSQWIAQAMNAWDCKCAVIGTLGNGFPGALSETANTTPDAIALHRALAGYIEQGAVACAMEVDRTRPGPRRRREFRCRGFHQPDPRPP